MNLFSSLARTHPCGSESSSSLRDAFWGVLLASLPLPLPRPAPLLPLPSFPSLPLPLGDHPGYSTGRSQTRQPKGVCGSSLEVHVQGRSCTYSYDQSPSTFLGDHLPILLIRGDYLLDGRVSVPGRRGIKQGLKHAIVLRFLDGEPCEAHLIKS